MKRTRTTTILAFLLFATTSALRAQTVTPVPSLDLDRFTGTWHEIARYPNKAGKACTGDPFDLFAAADKPHRFQLVTSCDTRSGYPRVRTASGRAPKNGDGKLQVTYLWPFTTSYWVLAMGPDYEWALLGSPNHKNLWLLSRTSTLAPEVLATMEAKAAGEGFPAAKIVMSPQPAR